MLFLSLCSLALYQKPTVTRKTQQNVFFPTKKLCSALPLPFPTENSTSNGPNSHVGSPSPRKKRNNSTPTRKFNAENRKILQQLISPNVSSKVGRLASPPVSQLFHSQTQVTLGELIQLSEKSNNFSRKSLDSDSAFTETTFNERPESSGQRKTLTRQVSSDPKLEKKVTFARLLSKMSAEINHGTDIDVSCRRHSNPNK